MENGGGLSGNEDDSLERATILKSPPKGETRLSSAVSCSWYSSICLFSDSTLQAIVKINKPASTKQSRSKDAILGGDIKIGWTKSIEPMFIYYYFYQLAPWPTSEDIERCAQTIYDWRFGETHPLTLAESPNHVQLVSDLDVRMKNLTFHFRS